MSEDRKGDLSDNEVAVIVQARADKVTAAARRDRLKFYGGIAFGALGFVAVAMGLIWHDHAVMVGGFVSGAVATGIIPFAEARKLWPFGKNGG